jgi:hypothetical protein
MEFPHSVSGTAAAAEHSSSAAEFDGRQGVAPTWASSMLAGVIKWALPTAGVR